MGLYLTILPQYNQGCDFSHDIYELGQDSGLFQLIQEAEDSVGRSLPRKGINSFKGNEDGFEGSCYGKTTETPWGSPLKGVLVSELKEAILGYKIEGWRNLVFVAILKELPDDLELWLYWH